MALCPDHPCEPVPEENFWTLWRKGRLTEADTQTIRLGAAPSRLTSVHLHHPLIFLQAGCPSCHPTNSVKSLKATGKQLQKICSTITNWNCQWHTREFALQGAWGLACDSGWLTGLDTQMYQWRTGAITMQTISTHNTTFKICTQLFTKNLEYILHITLCTVNFTINHWGWPWFYMKYMHVV